MRGRLHRRAMQRCGRRPKLLAALLFVACGVAGAQELPGTPQGELPPPLRSPYEEGGMRPAPPRAPQIIPIPVRRQRPRFTLVPDLRLSSGYSDNIFITPDVFSSGAIGDGLVTVSPRLRALVRLSDEVGLITDYGLSFTQFLSHGNSLQQAGVLFLGYRPSLQTHAEVGVRGGTARVSEFSQSDVNEGHTFLSGSIPLAPHIDASTSASVGLREFPERTRVESQALVIGIGPIQLPLPGSTTVVEKGDTSVVWNGAGALSLRYAPGGVLRTAYDFTDDDRDFHELSHRTHRVSMAGVNVWRDWLASRVSYSVAFRRFRNLASDESSIDRRDVIHDLGVGLVFTPKRLADLWFTRSFAIRLDYDLLLDRSNSSSGDLDRNFVSIAFEIGLPPLTGERIGRWLFPGLYGMPPSRSVSSYAPQADESH